MESDQEESQTSQNNEVIINPEEFYGKPISELKNIPLRKLLPSGYIKNLDPHFKLFCREIKNNLKEENYEIIAVTGFAGTGKSQLGALQGCLIDDNYSFGKNINFIPSSKQVESDYLRLAMYSYLHIDEASRSIHKHKWYEKTQQKLSTLYDTEREGHYLCSCLIMPRFGNFTENFRNFFIKYWINIVCRGVAIVYRRDEDKDTKDPWNIEESIKTKKKYWGGKRIFERTVSDIIRMEQKTKNYWFYFTIPEIPREVWSIYKVLKKQSRVDMRESEANLQFEDYREKLQREKMDRWKKLIELKNLGKTHDEISVELNTSTQTVRRTLREIEVYQKIKGSVQGVVLGTTNDKMDTTSSYNNIYNLKDRDKIRSIPDEFNQIKEK